MALLPLLLILIASLGLGLQTSNAATTANNQTHSNSTQAFPIQANKTTSLSSSSSLPTNQSQNRTQTTSKSNQSVATANTNITAQPSNLSENISKSDIAKLQQKLLASSIYGPAILNQPYRVTVNFDSITVHHDHDDDSSIFDWSGSTSGSGEWFLDAFVQGQRIDLTEASNERLLDVDDGDTINFKPGTKVTVDIPKTQPLSIFTLGSESDVFDSLFPFGGGPIKCVRSFNFENEILKIFEFVPPSEWFDFLSDYQMGWGCADNDGSIVGLINKIYDPPSYGQGAHTNVISSTGDFTLRYTISVQAPPLDGVEPFPCSDKLGVSTVSASSSQSGFPPTNVIDNDLATYWKSTSSHNPSITLDLGSQRQLCVIGIAWHDGNSHIYKFNIAVSKDGTSYTNVFSGTSSGATTSPEAYSLGLNEGRFVKITVTQSSAESLLSSSSSTARISEVGIYGR